MTAVPTRKLKAGCWPTIGFQHCCNDLRLAMCLLILSTTTVLSNSSTSNSSPMLKSARNASLLPPTSPSPPMPNRPPTPQQPSPSRKIMRPQMSVNTGSNNSISAGSSGTSDMTVTTNPPYGPPPSPPVAMTYDVRLVNGSSPDNGRLILGLVKYLVAAAMEVTAWEALCDDGNFNATLAGYFCGLMGYRYGQQFSKDGISTYTDTTLTYSPFSKITCKRELNTTDDIWRRTYWYTKFPSPAELQCQAVKYPSNCPRGQLVALQCSHTPLTPSSSSSTPIQAIASPLPSNPSDVSRTIQLLSAPQTGQRVELLVNTLSGGSVWAPLCVSPAEWEYYNTHDASSQDGLSIAAIVCNQARNFQRQLSLVSTFYSQGAPLAISETVFGRSPSHWVTIIGGIQAGVGSIQQMTLQVSNTSCSSGHIFIAFCREIHF